MNFELAETEEHLPEEIQAYIYKMPENWTSNSELEEIEGGALLWAGTFTTYKEYEDLRDILSRKRGVIVLYADEDMLFYGATLPDEDTLISLICRHEQRVDVDKSPFDEKWAHIPEFYPTPPELAKKMLDGVKFSHVKYVLEPSAGKGDLVDALFSAIKNASDYYDRYANVDVDMIEKDPELQCLLKGKEFDNTDPYDRHCIGCRLVHDDFLSFSTRKHYDLILMNPPFSKAAEHVFKALRMQQQTGGAVIALLNAQTLKNPCTNVRKALLKELTDAGASIEYVQDAFLFAERKTSVEVAIVKVLYPAPEFDCSFMNRMKKKQYEEFSPEDITALTVECYLTAAIQKYQIDIDTGISLIKEFKGAEKVLVNRIDKGDETDHYKSPLLELRLNGGKSDLTINDFVRTVRMKYWNALFRDERFTKGMTSNLSNQYSSQVDKLADYDFSLFNIREIQISMLSSMSKGIEECIMALFEELTQKYSWEPQTENNIHYYNGWASNKAYKVNSKVVLPCMNAWRTWGNQKDYDPDSYELGQKIHDIHCALAYLDGTPGLLDNSVYYALRRAKASRQTKDIQMPYFNCTFYKKGTCHIVFTSEDLLKKFNLFAGKNKNWLPKDYGKKPYEKCSEEEQNVIKEFEGVEAYRDTVNRADYFLVDSTDLVPRIGTAQ